jgi:hypothetical protein
MTQARYAVYYAPARDHPLTQRAEHWLGRSAFDGAPRDRPTLAGLADLDLDAHTADPRFYGFHATMRAPFELAQGFSEDALVELAATFAADQTPFSCAIAPAALGRFIAFRPTGDDQPLRNLHAAAMEAFQPARAPLSEADIARRRRANLTPLQDQRLFTYGYPYIFEDFRFHMTLTGAIVDDAVRQRIAAGLTEHFAGLSGPHRFDAIALFRQPDRSSPFHVLDRFPIGR